MDASFCSAPFIDDTLLNDDEITGDDELMSKDYTKIDIGPSPPITFGL